MDVAELAFTAEALAGLSARLTPQATLEIARVGRVARRLPRALTALDRYMIVVIKVSRELERERFGAGRRFDRATLVHCFTDALAFVACVDGELALDAQVLDDTPDLPRAWCSLAGGRIDDWCREYEALPESEEDDPFEQLAPRLRWIFIATQTLERSSFAPDVALLRELRVRVPLDRAAAPPVDPVRSRIERHARTELECIPPGSARCAVLENLLALVDGVLTPSDLARTTGFKSTTLVRQLADELRRLRPETSVTGLTYAAGRGERHPETLARRRPAALASDG